MNAEAFAMVCLAVGLMLPVNRIIVDRILAERLMAKRTALRPGKRTSPAGTRKVRGKEDGR